MQLDLSRLTLKRSYTVDVLVVSRLLELTLFFAVQATILMTTAAILL